MLGHDDRPQQHEWVLRLAQFGTEWEHQTIELDTVDYSGVKLHSIAIPKPSFPANDPLTFTVGLMSMGPAVPQETFWFRCKKNRDTIAAWLNA